MKFAKYSLIFIQLLCLFLVSCAGGDSQKTQNSDRGTFSHILGVQLEREQGSLVSPEVSDSLLEDSNMLSQYPQLTEGSPKLLPVIAITLGPGGSRAFAHIKALREFEAQGIYPSMISGTGMGAVIAALYSFGLSLDLIEWRIFNFLNAVEELENFSPAWQRNVENILLQDIGSRQIESAQMTLVLPTYDSISRRVIVHRRGPMKDMILSQFRFSPDRSGNRFIAPYPFNVFLVEELRALGADIVFGVDVLGTQVSLKKPNSFLSGIYGRAISVTKRQQTSLDGLVVLSTQNLSPDSYLQADLRNIKSNENLHDNIAALKQKIQEWRGGEKTQDKTPTIEFDSYIFMDKELSD